MKRLLIAMVLALVAAGTAEAGFLLDPGRGAFLSNDPLPDRRPPATDEEIAEARHYRRIYVGAGTGRSASAGLDWDGWRNPINLELRGDWHTGKRRSTQSTILLYLGVPLPGYFRIAVGAGYGGFAWEYQDPGDVHRKGDISGLLLSGRFGWYGETVAVRISGERAGSRRARNGDSRTYELAGKSRADMFSEAPGSYSQIHLDAIHRRGLSIRVSQTRAHVDSAGIYPRQDVHDLTAIVCFGVTR